MEELLPGRLPFISSHGNPGEKGGTDPDSWCLVIPFTSGNDAFEAIIRFVRVAGPRFATGKGPAEEKTSRSEDFNLRFLRGSMGGGAPDQPAAENFAAVAVDLTFRHLQSKPGNAAV